MSAPVTAVKMREHLASDDVDWVWRMLLQGRDHLGLILDADEPALIGSWEAEPVSAGATGWDALLAAITAREFERAGHSAPGWALTDPLPKAWIPDHPFLDPERVKARTPAWLSDRNIFIPARDLVTA